MSLDIENRPSAEESYLVACIEEYKDVCEHTAEDDCWTELTYRAVAGRWSLQWVKLAFLQCKIGTIGSATAPPGLRYILDCNVNPFTIESTENELVDGERES